MHRILAFTPVFISLFWVIFIISGAAAYCKPPRVDEGAAAHIFQLLMIAQIPLIVGFILTKGDRPLIRIVPMIALQVFAWAAAAVAAARLT